jgi:large subunit ribosomal protein L17
MAVIELVREKTVTNEANRARRAAASAKKAAAAAAAPATAAAPQADVESEAGEEGTAESVSYVMAEDAGIADAQTAVAEEEQADEA